MENRKKCFTDYKLKADEYIDEITGLVHCSKCKEPKQCKIELEEMQRIVPSNCKCERDRFAKLEEQKKQEELEERRAWAIEIAKYRKFTFARDNGLDKDTSEICKRYVDNFARFKAKGIGLLLYGSVGTGKTFYAHAIANALIDKGYRVKSTNLSKIIDFYFDKQYKEIESILVREIIVLDDIGAERNTSYAEEKIFNFIDKAIAMNKVLILTTNLTLKEMKEMRDDTGALERARVYSRILEKCVPVKVNVVKQREIKEEENKKLMQELLKGERE